MRVSLSLSPSRTSLSLSLSLSLLSVYFMHTLAYLATRAYTGCLRRPAHSLACNQFDERRSLSLSFSFSFSLES
jgi:hypothetical protein